MAVRGVQFPLPEPPQAHTVYKDNDPKAIKDLITWARKLHIALPLILRNLPGPTVITPPTTAFPAYTITNRTPDRSYNADITTIDELADVLGTLIFEVSTGIPLGTYTITNVTTDRSYDANATSLNELADVVGTLVADLVTGPPGVYTPSNVTTSRSYDANAVSLDRLADTLGTFIHDLQAFGLVG